MIALVSIRLPLLEGVGMRGGGRVAGSSSTEFNACMYVSSIYLSRSADLHSLVSQNMLRIIHIYAKLYIRRESFLVHIPPLPRMIIRYNQVDRV